jgi:hypothetical protein
MVGMVVLLKKVVPIHGCGLAIGLKRPVDMMTIGPRDYDFGLIDDGLHTRV